MIVDGLHALVLGVVSGMPFGARFVTGFVLQIGRFGGVCVRGVWRVLLCLLLVLAAELLPAWFV